MNTGTKVLIGVVAAAGIGTAIYFGFIRKADEITSTGGGEGGSSTPPGGDGQSPSTPEKDKTKLQKIQEEAKRKLKDVQCNLKYPPPRTKKSKKEAYRACLHSADASCGRNYSCTACPMIAALAADGGWH